MKRAVLLALGAALLLAAVLFVAGKLANRFRDYEAEAAEMIAQDVRVNAAYFAAHQSADELAQSMRPMSPRTHVEIRGEQVFINGRPTYEGRVWRGARIEGLLLNARMVQGIFDDLNPETAPGWAYPDTGLWNAERNTAEFIAAMPSWREKGLIAFSLNLQGGNAHADNETWVNSAFAPDGQLHSSYFRRLRLILEEADRQGMVVILGLFYFRHDGALRDEAAVIAALDNTLDWLHAVGARNVLIEINNECDLGAYDHAILECERVGELIDRAKARLEDGYRFAVSTSLQGGSIPDDDLLRRLDYVLLHGNSIEEPAGIARMIEEVRGASVWRPMPIIFNEDDHFDLTAPVNKFTVAVSNYAAWGFFLRRHEGDPLSEGYQSVPVDWTISSPRKRQFFDLVAEMTGVTGADAD